MQTLLDTFAQRMPWWYLESARWPISSSIALLSIPIAVPLLLGWKLLHRIYVQLTMYEQVIVIDKAGPGRPAWNHADLKFQRCYISLTSLYMLQSNWHHIPYDHMYLWPHVDFARYHSIYSMHVHYTLHANSNICPCTLHVCMKSIRAGLYLSKLHLSRSLPSWYCNAWWT